MFLADLEGMEFIHVETSSIVKRCRQASDGLSSLKAKMDLLAFSRGRKTHYVTGPR